jgi:hypothetical protein
MSKSIKSNIKKVAQNACHRLGCKLQHDVPKEAELDSKCLCFNEFCDRRRRFKLVAKLQTEKLPGDLQDVECFFVPGFQFREEFLLLQLKCNLLVGSQDRTYSFRNARNREDAAQRLQRFVHWEVSFEEIFHRKFAMLALNVHGLRHGENYIGW